MKRLGISIYPDKATIDENKKYIELAAKYNFKRIFTNLLTDQSRTKEEIIDQFKEIIHFANQKGLEVIVDVAPKVYKMLDITFDDLSFFKSLGVSGIRLDESFNGAIESQLTWNKENLKIEMNASAMTKTIDNIVSFGANTDNLITCHNFYPQRYTGLSYDLFMKETLRLKNLGLKVAAFVSSNVDNAFGPWPVNEGLPTLEMHRDIPIDIQVRHMYATGIIDDIIISNCFASEEEISKIASIDPNKLTFKIVLNENVLDLEREIIFNHPHVVRGDMSSYMIRSSMPRITYKNESITSHNNNSIIKPGDVIIVNDEYGRYKGELHIALKEMKNDGRKNIVGYIPKEDFILFDFIEPWRVFTFIE